MDKRPVAKAISGRPLLDLLPMPMRRASGAVLLTLTLWLASFLALVR
jgi:hypothetical protein